jgi:hypothetical protein
MVRRQSLKTRKTINVGFHLVVRSANGVGSRFRPTIYHMGSGSPENDPRSLPPDFAKKYLAGCLNAECVPLPLKWKICVRKCGSDPSAFQTPSVLHERKERPMKTYSKMGWLIAPFLAVPLFALAVANMGASLGAATEGETKERRVAEVSG